MNSKFKKFVLQQLNASDIVKVELIQSLWSGYGSIIRYKVIDGDQETVIIKHVSPPNSDRHPRGWNTNRSHERKLKSYKVESAWYKDWSVNVDEYARVPICFGIENIEEEVCIILEDLDASGFAIRRSSVSEIELQNCIRWLANFHASHLHKRPKGLWKMGTYWHLETRPDELEVLCDVELKNASSKIDLILKESPYQTIVHGDAKLANFCFSETGEVAVVDFQYVGGGIGMKDLVYFVGSCFYEEDCEAKQDFILDFYFKEMKLALDRLNKEVDFIELEENWRNLYPVAWTDFHRFLKGWSPGHWKINSYSERLTREVLETINA